MPIRSQPAAAPLTLSVVIRGPLVQADGLAVQRFDPRPRPRGPKQQVTTGLRNPQQVGQPGILVGVDRDQLHPRVESADPRQTRQAGPRVEHARPPGGRVLAGVEARRVGGFDLGRAAAGRVGASAFAGLHQATIAEVRSEITSIAIRRALPRG